MRRFLIDTNIYSYALKGEVSVADVLRGAEEIGFSVISVGELIAGFKGGTREQKNRKELWSFLDSPRVIIYPVDEDTAEFYGEIVQGLKNIGKPVPVNDIWIAAVAFQNGLKLYTRDKHFENIAGLSLL